MNQYRAQKQRVCIIRVLGRSHQNTHSKMVVGSTNHIVSPIEVPRNGTTPSPPPGNVLMAKVSRWQWAGEQPRAHKRQGEPDFLWQSLLPAWGQS